MPQSDSTRPGAIRRDSSRPNVVVMHCHDLGRFLGCYGNETVATPHLDGLAADGVRFDRSFTTAPQCSPSRASLFTGRYPHVNGVLGLTHQDFAWDLHPGERHLGGLLRDQGYRSVLLGVQHESRVRPDEETADRLGFDHVDTSTSRAEPVSQKAIEQLGQLVEGDRPFYLQVGFIEPHRMGGERDEPGVMGFLGNHLEPDDSLGVAIPPYLQDTPSARTELAELQGAVRHMDAAAGRVLAELDRLDAADNTIMVFTTDHGLALPRAKCSLYDPGLETALIIRYPDGGWTGGQVNDALVSHVDLLPTLLDAAGSAAGDNVHGRSFLPLLNGEDHARREEIFGEMTYHDYYDPRRCIRTERHKLIANFSSAPAFMDPSQGWMRRCRPKVQTEGPASYHPSLELYDLQADPDELTNLADDPDHAGVVAELSARLAEWMTQTKDPLVDGAVTSPLHTKTMDALLRA